MAHVSQSRRAEEGRWYEGGLAEPEMENSSATEEGFMMRFVVSAAVLAFVTSVAATSAVGGGYSHGNGSGSCSFTPSTALVRSLPSRHAPELLLCAHCRTFDV